MAIIETTIDIDRQLTIQTVTGEATFAEIAHAIKTYYEGVVTKFVLWDSTQAVLDNVKANEVEALAALTKKCSGRRKGGKTALVFSSDLGFGIGRMFDTHHEILASAVSHGSFRSREEALKWLLE